jgi:hypothetical protein
MLVAALPYCRQKKKQKKQSIIQFQKVLSSSIPWRKILRLVSLWWYSSFLLKIEVRYQVQLSVERRFVFITAKHSLAMSRNFVITEINLL